MARCVSLFQACSSELRASVVGEVARLDDRVYKLQVIIESTSEVMVDQSVHVAIVEGDVEELQQC